MNPHRKLILYFLAACTAFGFFKTLLLGYQAGQVLKMDYPSQGVGMGKELQKLVQDLESQLAARMARETAIQTDPLQVSRIIYNRSSKVNQQAEIAESFNQMRLSCTILSSQRTVAIIKHRGKSYVLGIGDELNGYRIQHIDKKTVVLSGQGKEIVLVNRPAPLSEMKYQAKARLDEMKL